MVSQPRDNSISPESVSRSQTIRDLHVSFPDFDFVHEIVVSGTIVWKTLVALAEILSNSDCKLVSFSARRYGVACERVSCRVEDLTDDAWHRAADEINRLPGVTGVSLVNHLCAGQGGARGMSP